MTVTVTDTVTVPAIAPGDTTCREFSLRLNACCSTQMWFPITILHALCVIHTDFQDFRAEPRQAEKLFPLLGLGNHRFSRTRLGSAENEKLVLGLGLHRATRAERRARSARLQACVPPAATTTDAYPPCLPCLAAGTLQGESIRRSYTGAPSADGSGRGVGV